MAYPQLSDQVDFINQTGLEDAETIWKFGIETFESKVSNFKCKKKNKKLANCNKST